MIAAPTLLALTGAALTAVAVFSPVTARPARPPRGAVSALIAPVAAATWPTAIEPSAADCTVEARLDLVEALASLATPWAETMLVHARADEPDAGVLASIEAALSAIQSRVR